MRILLLDNYDSFTYNLYHYFSSLGCSVEVYRNDKISIKEIEKKKYKKIIISPGPGTPNQSGLCPQIVKYFAPHIPILGVCLGHQIIGQVFSSKIINAKKIMHGKLSTIRHKRIGIFKNIKKQNKNHLYRNPEGGLARHSLTKLPTRYGANPSNIS